VALICVFKFVFLAQVVTLLGNNSGALIESLVLLLNDDTPEVNTTQCGFFQT